MVLGEECKSIIPVSESSDPFPNVNYVTPINDGKPPIYWLIDIGSTHHITPNFHNFKFHYFVPSITIKLPNGTTVSTNIVGFVHLSNSLILCDVYYIPTFQVNLIFASKLIDSYAYTLTFTNKDCFIL